MNAIRSLTSLAVLLAATASSHSQYVVLPPPPGPIVAPAPVVRYSYYAPVAPAPVFAAPAVSYYSAPAVSYYPAPTVSYYSAPAVSYSVPVAPVYGGSYVTRTYTGYGIFRPRGTYTESYYRPW
jgi:hypothetical protein